MRPCMPAARYTTTDHECTSRQRRAKVSDDVVRQFMDASRPIDPSLRYGPGCTGEKPKAPAAAPVEKSA